MPHPGCGRCAVTFVVWEDPPASSASSPRAVTKPTKWQVNSELLRRRPGVWAIVERFNEPNYGEDRDKARARSTARNLSVGLYNGCEDVEAVAREVDGEWRVYARYIGGAL